MRYIGNKTKLLEFITENIIDTLQDKIDLSGINKLFDLFSGIGTVSEHLKQYFNIVGNDLLYSSYLTTKVKLQGENIDIPNKLYVDLNRQKVNGFITTNYSEGSDRLYFSKINGQKIDGIRLYLESLKNKNEITIDQYEYLLYCLLVTVHGVSNTTGVYGAFLKKLQSNALNELKIEKQPIKKSGRKHECYNKDCIELLGDIRENDIVYIDPPYNSRQYVSNYHLLDTIIKYDNPEIKIVGKNKSKSVTGLRKDIPSSKWCSKKNIKAELEKILGCHSRFIFMSYNTEGLINEEEIKELFEKYGTLTIKRKCHKKYKSNKNENNKNIEELLFCLVK